MEYLELKYRTIQVYGEVSPGNKCIIESRVHGLFAAFYCLLYGLYICENESLAPVINLGKEHLYYDPAKGENIFDYFYDQDRTAEAPKCRIVVVHPFHFLLWCRNSMKEKRISNYFINKYFKLNEPIKNELNGFYEKEMKGHSILGVHYRGRDKITETDIVPFDEYETKIVNMLKNNICDKVLFITDVLELREKIKAKYSEKIILYGLEADYEAAKVEDQAKAGLHFLNTDSRYLMAKDALMECYLLSRCDLFMSSFHSSMSLFVTFINPEIPHIIIEP